MRRSDKRRLWGNETDGQKGGAGMMGHLAVHRAGGGQPRGKWTRADRVGVPEYMHLYPRGVGRLLNDAVRNQMDISCEGVLNPVEADNCSPANLRAEE